MLTLPQPNSMSCNPSLEGTAKILPLQDSATCEANDYATPQLSIRDCANKAETRLAHKFFDQIDDAKDGSLVVHHARGAKVPPMEND